MCESQPTKKGHNQGDKFSQVMFFSAGCPYMICTDIIEENRQYVLEHIMRVLTFENLKITGKIKEEKKKERFQENKS